jgi:hypothetical protein
METMKHIYVYNPDYTTINIYKGSVKLEENNSSFISNLLCHYSKLKYENNKTLNDYIGILNIHLSEYFKLLSERSLISITEDNKLKPQLEFIINIDELGEGNTYCLLNSLNFNTQKPLNLINDLEYSNSMCAVRDSERNIYPINEHIKNKYAFYTYDKELRKLIQLDVSNYIIKESGEL